MALWAALLLVLAAAATTPSPAGDAPARQGKASAVVATVPMPSGENNFQAATIHSESGHVLFGTSTSPGRVVKVRLGAADEAPAYLATLALETGENDLQSAVMDPSSGHAYFGTYTGIGRVIKVDLEDGDAAPRRVGALELSGVGGYLRSAVIDPAGGHAYFGTGLSTGRVVKVALGAGEALPTQVGSATFPAGSGGPVSAVIDPLHGHAYFGTSASPGRVVKVALGEGSLPPSIVGATILPAGHDDLTSAMIDVENGLLYFVSQTSPGLVAKLSVGALDAPPTFLWSTSLESGGLVADSPRVALADETGQAGLVATFTQPANLVSLDLEASGGAPVVSGILPLVAGNSEILARCGVHDPVTGRALIGTRTVPARVIKVDPGFSTTPPIVAMPTGEYEVRHVSRLARSRSGNVLALSTIPSLQPRICADGSDTTVFHLTFDMPSPDPMAYRMELAGPGGVGMDPLQGGSFAVENPTIRNRLSFRYTHPEDFGAAGAMRAETARLVHVATGQMLLEIPVEIYRAPVLMLHGLWGDASGFKDMEARLLGFSSSSPPPAPPDSPFTWTEVTLAADNWPGEGRFRFRRDTFAIPPRYEFKELVASSPLLLRHQYPNDSAFQSNTSAVGKGAQILLERALRERYSAGKVDVVAHSMGGVLTRAAMQQANNTGYVRSLVTLDTPHWGSQFANWLQGQTLGAIQLDTMGVVFLARVFGAVGSFQADGVRDLRVSRRSSDLPRLDITRMMEDLDREPEFPAHFVAVRDPGGWTTAALTALLTIPAAYDGYLLPPNASNLINDIFGQDPLDQIVSLPSQLGGMPEAHPATTVFPGYHHVGVQSEEAVMDHVLALLLGSREGDTWSARVQPRPSEFAYDFSIGIGGIGARRAGTEIVDGVQVTLPNGEQAIAAGSTVTVRVTSTHGFESATLLALVGDGVFGMGLLLPADAPISVPADAVEDLVLMVLATNEAGEFSSATLEIPVIPSSDPIAIIASWPDQIIIPAGTEAYYSARILYDAGGEVLLDPTSGGAAEAADPSIADVGEWGVIRALAEGDTTITVRLGELEASTTLAVLPADAWDPPSVTGWQVE